MKYLIGAMNPPPGTGVGTTVIVAKELSVEVRLSLLEKIKAVRKFRESRSSGQGIQTGIIKTTFWSDLDENYFEPSGEILSALEQVSPTDGPGIYSGAVYREPVVAPLLKKSANMEVESRKLHVRPDGLSIEACLGEVPLSTGFFAEDMISAGSMSEAPA